MAPTSSRSRPGALIFNRISAAFCWLPPSNYDAAAYDTLSDSCSDHPRPNSVPDSRSDSVPDAVSNAVPDTVSDTVSDAVPHTITDAVSNTRPHHSRSDAQTNAVAARCHHGPALSSTDASANASANTTAITTTDATTDA
jgi:hypothetical protein